MNLLDAMSLRQGGDLCGSASFEKKQMIEMEYSVGMLRNHIRKIIENGDSSEKG